MADTPIIGTIDEQFRPQLAAAFPGAQADALDDAFRAMIDAGLMEQQPHRGINAVLFGEGFYAIRQSDFDWLTWAMALLGGPVGVIKQLRMLTTYRKRRVKLDDVQARVLLALLDQPANTATAAVLAAGLEPKYGLSARKIAAVLEGLEGARREDGVPARVVVREGDAWRAEDL